MERKRMSYCDVEREVIIDCKKGTKRWLHEKGHIEYNKSEKGLKNDFRMSFYFSLSVTAMIVALFNDFFKYCAVVFIIIFWGYYAYEEWWCWEYAQKKINEMKGGGKNGMEKKEKD